MDNPFIKFAPPEVQAQAQAVTAAQAQQAQSNNPFLKFTSSPQTQQQGTSNYGAVASAPVQQDAETSGSWSDRLTIFNRGFERYAIGALRLLHPAGFSDEALSAYDKKSEAEYQQAYQRTPSPATDFLGKAGGAITASAPAVMAATTAGPATVANLIGQGAAAGFASGAIENADSYKERLTKGVIGGVLGGALPAAGHIAGSTLETLLPNNTISPFIKKFLFPEAAAKQDIAHAITLDTGNDQGAALDKINTVIKSGTQGRTPGEMLSTGPDSVIRNLESDVKLDAGDKGVVANSIVNRANQTKQQILDTVQSMNTPTLQNTEASGYKKMESEFIGQDNKLITDNPQYSGRVPEVIMSNPTLIKAYKDVVKTDNPDIQNLPMNSVAQLHKVRDYIDDKLFNDTPNKITGDKAVALDMKPRLELQAAKNLITPILQQSDTYNETMAASNLIARNKYYNKLMDSTPSDIGANGQLTPQQVTKIIMPNELRSKIFLQDAVKAGGDPEQISKLIEVANSLKDSNQWDVLNSQVAKTQIGGRTVGIVQRFLSNMTLKNYYKALSNVMLSGDKWAPEIANVLKSPNQQEGFLNLMMNAADKLNTVNKTTRAGLTGVSTNITHVLTDKPQGEQNK